MQTTFQKNLGILAKQFSQKQIAMKTGFSQSSINNYLTKASEPSIQFLIALKDAFGICVDDFLFSDFSVNEERIYDKYIGNYIAYYYNNDSYKGEVHSNLKNTLNYGVISVFKEKSLDKNVRVLATFTKNRVEATKMLKNLNLAQSQEIPQIYEQIDNVYVGSLDFNDQSIFLHLENKKNLDKTYIIMNNPPSKAKYIGGAGTVNSVSRGREHNPCSQLLILSQKLLDLPDGAVYNMLKFNDYHVNLDDGIKDIIELFKRLYVLQNELSAQLTETQKMAIVKNKIEYIIDDIMEANAFRFAKISNKDDDVVYQNIKEGIDV